jgi:hypothetical protein
MGARNRGGIGLLYQATKAGGIHSLESISGLHKRLKIRAPELIPSLRIDSSESIPVPVFKDPVFAKTSPKRSFSFIEQIEQNARFLLSENERFGLVFVKTGSINSGAGQIN